MAEKTNVKEIEADLKRMLNMTPSKEVPKTAMSDKDMTADLKRLLNKPPGKGNPDQDDNQEKSAKQPVVITKEDLLSFNKDTAPGKQGQAGKKKPKSKPKKKGGAEDGAPASGQRGETGPEHPHHQQDPEAAPGTNPVTASTSQNQKKKKKKKKKKGGKTDSEDSEDDRPREPVQSHGPSAAPVLTIKYLDGSLTPAVLNELEKEKIFPLKKKSLKFPHAKYFCRLCDYHCDNVPVCRQHANDARHRRRKEIMIQDKKLHTLPEPTLEHLASLDALLEGIWKQHGLAEEQRAYRETLVTKLQEFLAQTIPDIQMRMYGSTLSGLGLNTSDLNIDLIVDKKSNPAHRLAEVYRILKASEEYRDVRSNFMDKVPAVVFHSPCGTVRCQVSVGTETAYYTSRYLNIYANMDPRVAKLAVIFRHWAKVCQVDVQENGSLPSYSYGLMAIYYLQQCRPPVLPVIWKSLTEETLRRPKTTQDIIDMLDQLEKETWTSDNKSSMGQLWRDLLLFYGVKFDLKECIICIRALKPVYRAEKKWKSKRVAIEDPFSCKRNVARSLQNTRIFDYFYNCLRKACVYFSLPTSHSNVAQYIQVESEPNKKRTSPQHKQKEANKTKAARNESRKLELVKKREQETSGIEVPTEDVESSKAAGPETETSDGLPDAHKGTDGSSDGGILDNSFLDGSTAASGLDDSLVEGVDKLSVGEDQSKNTDETKTEDSASNCVTENSQTTDSALNSSASKDQDEKVTEKVDQAATINTPKEKHKETSNESVKDEKPVEDSVNDATSVEKEHTEQKEDSVETNENLGAKQTGADEAETGAEADCDKKESEKQDGADNKSCDMEDECIDSDNEEESGSGSDVDSSKETSDSSPVRQKRVKNKTGADVEYKFEFSLGTLTDGKGPSIFCQICEKEGHLKACCPEDVLPDIIDLPPVTPQHTKFLNSAIQQVPKDFKMSPRETEERENILYNLEAHVQDTFADAEMCLFGSSKNGFGFHQSDLDICVTFSGKKAEDIDFIACIEGMCKKLKFHRGLYNVFPITTAKVPIVKFKHRQSQLEGDISLYNILAQQNTHMLHTYSCIDPRVVTMVFAIKVFVKVCDIGDASKGSLSSYAYTLMMLHYLQQTSPPVLPVLQELRTEDDDDCELLIEGWNAWFYDDLDNLPKVWPGYGKNRQNVGELWLGFFRYYLEDFSFFERVVTIKQYEPLTKFEKLWNGRCIAIEDPFDLNHNLGGALSRRMNQYILRTFVHARELYGTSISEVPPGFPTFLDYFFDQSHLTEGEPPSDRLCRVCSKIGHIAKECPRLQARKEREANERKRKEEMRKANEERDTNSPGRQGRPSSVRSLSDPAEHGSPGQNRGPQFHRQHSYNNDSSPGRRRAQPLMSMNVTTPDKYSRNQPSSPQQQQRHAQPLMNMNVTTPDKYSRNQPGSPQQQVHSQTFQRQDQQHRGPLLGHTPPGQGYYNMNQNYGNAGAGGGGRADNPSWRNIQAHNNGGGGGNANYYPKGGKKGQGQGQGQRAYSGGGNRGYPPQAANQYQPYVRHPHPDGQVLVNLNSPPVTGFENYLTSTGYNYMITNPPNVQYVPAYYQQAASFPPSMALNAATVGPQPQYQQQYAVGSETSLNSSVDENRNGTPVYVPGWLPACSGVPLYVSPAPVSEAGSQDETAGQGGGSGTNRVVNVHKSPKAVPDVGITVKNEYYKGQEK